MEGNVDMPTYVVTAVAISVFASLIIGMGSAFLTVLISKHLTDYRLKELEAWKDRHTAEFAAMRDSLTTLVADVKWIRDQIERDEEARKR